MIALLTFADLTVFALGVVAVLAFAGGIVIGRWSK